MTLQCLIIISRVHGIEVKLKSKKITIIIINQSGKSTKNRYSSVTEYLYQSIKIYIAPIQDPYSEAFLTQAKRKSTVLRRWLN